jgi:YVTN family beta-propeller protein
VCAASLLLLGWPARGRAQSIEAAVALPNQFSPGYVAINSVTNTIYVGNVLKSLLVFNATTDTYKVISLPNYTGAMDVNPVTNMLYITDSTDDVVTVLNGATNATTTVPIPMGSDPSDVAVDTITNKIYVANNGGDYVTVIDGATNDTSTVSVGTQPVALAVNDVTNQVFVVDQGSSVTDGYVTVLNGAVGSTPATVAATLQVGPYPGGVAVNPVTNTAYVANGSFGTGSTVSVINGATDTVSATLTTGTEPGSLAVNPVTNQIYVVNTDDVDSLTGSPSASVVVINGATNSVTTLLTGSPYEFVRVNPLTNQVYVGVSGGNLVVINGNASPQSVVATLFVGGDNIAVNPVTNQIYAFGDGTNSAPNGSPPAFSGASIAVIDGSTDGTTTVPVGTEPNFVGVNSATDDIYVANEGDGTVSVINGQNNTIIGSPVSLGGVIPFSVVVNPVTNKIYVDTTVPNSVTEIDASNNNSTTSFLPVPPAYYSYFSPSSMALNAVTNKLYVIENQSICGVNPCPNVNGILGVTDTTTDIAETSAVILDFNPSAMVLDQATNQIYVVNTCGTDSTCASTSDGTVTVIDGATNNTTRLTVGLKPDGIALDPVTNKIYVTNNCGNGPTCVATSLGSVTVIDGATSTTPATVEPAAITVEGSPGKIAVDPATDTIYVINVCGTDSTCTSAGSVSVINGATDAVVATVPVGTDPDVVAVNAATNKIYVTNEDSNNVTIIDGISNSSSTLAVETDPVNAVVNPATNQIYVSNLGSNNVTVITEAQIQPVPLTTTISSTAITGGATTDATPPFTFTAVSAFSPTAPAVDNVYFQMDTISGQWTVATPGAGNFTGTPSTALSLGTHIIYAFATDGGQDASSVGGYYEESRQELNGPIAAEVFTVTGTSTSLIGTSTSVSADNNPQLLGQEVTFTAGVEATADPIELPTGTVTFYDSATELGSGPVAFNLSTGGPAMLQTSSLAAGSHSITAVYSGDSNYAGSTSPVYTEVIDNPVPTLTSLSQNSATAGSSGFTLMLMGTNFVTTSVAQWNGAALSTTYVSATQVNAVIPTGDLASVGSASVTVFNPAPGGGTSTPALMFTITAVTTPTPVITSLVPPSTIAGGAGFTLMVNGSGFESGSTVEWNGTALTTSGSSSPLSATVPAGLIATAGTASITVFNPTLVPGVVRSNAVAESAPSGITSNALTFTINNPVPTLTALSQNSATAGSGGFTLMLTGTNFVATSVAQWNGVGLSTTYVSATQLNAVIPTGDLATAGTAGVTVFNPTPGGGTSTPALTFTINAVVSTPTVTSLVPPSAIVGGPAFTLTVNGSNFISTSIVEWNGTGLTTTYVSATQLTASVPATDIATAGMISVTVLNPTAELDVRRESARSLAAPAGTLSNALTFDIVDFTVSSATSPQTVSAGSSAMFAISTAAVDGTFPNAVTFSASGLPSGAVAMFSPSSVTPGTGTTMTITTEGCVGAIVAPKPLNPREPIFPLSSPRSVPVWLELLALAILLAGLGVAGRIQRTPLRRLVPITAMILLVVAAGYLAGCAGGFPLVENSTCTSETPSGTYTITVTATSGSDMHTTTVTLTIGTVNL